MSARAVFDSASLRRAWNFRLTPVPGGTLLELSYRWPRAHKRAGRSLAAAAVPELQTLADGYEAIIEAAAPPDGTP